MFVSVNRRNNKARAHSAMRARLHYFRFTTMKNHFH